MHLIIATANVLDSACQVLRCWPQVFLGQIETKPANISKRLQAKKHLKLQVDWAPCFPCFPCFPDPTGHSKQRPRIKCDAEAGIALLQHCGGLEAPSPLVSCRKMPSTRIQSRKMFQTFCALNSILQTCLGAQWVADVSCTENSILWIGFSGFMGNSWTVPRPLPYNLPWEVLYKRRANLPELFQFGFSFSFSFSGYSASCLQKSSSAQTPTSGAGRGWMALRLTCVCQFASWESSRTRENPKES